MPISRADITKRLKPGLAALMGKGYASFANQCTQIYEKRNATKATEEMVMVTGFGLAPRKTEGAQILLDQANDSFTARADMVTYSLGYAITQEAIEDNLYERQATDYANALTRSFGETKETTGAAILNLAFSVGSPVGDGQPLCSANHPLQGGGVMSNTTAVDLSETALKGALTSIRTGFRDERGLKIRVSPHMPIVHPSNQFTIFEILRSDLSTSVTNVTNAGALNGTANVVAATNVNNINSLKSKGFFRKEAMVYDYLTDDDAWFIQTDAPNGLIHWERAKFSMEMSYKDPFTGNIIVTARDRYAFMVGDFRAIWGSPGA